MTNYWTDFSENTKDILHNFVEQSVKLEFASIGDAFDSLLDSMLNMFVDWIAKMVANWAMSGLTELVINGTLDGFSLGSLFSGSSGSGGGALGTAYQVGSSANTVSGWFGGPSTSSITAPVSSYASGQLGLGTGTLGTNLATGAQAVYGAGTTGVGTIGSWYAGLQAAGNGVNAGTQLALIEGTYGQEITTAATTAATNAASSTAATAATNAATQATVDYSVDAAGGYAADSAATAGGAGTAGWASAGWAALPLILGSIWMGIENNSDKQFGEQNYMMTNAELQGNMSFDSHDAEQKYLDQTLQDIFKNSFDSLTSELGTSFDDLANFAATHLDTSGIEHFVEAFGGIDISAEQSAQVLALATEAAHGNAAAYHDLQATMVGFGLDAEQSSQATETLMEAMRRAGEVSDITLGQMLNREAEDITLADLEGALTQAMTVNGESVQSLIAGYDGSSESLEGLIGELTGYEESVHSNAEMLQLATSAAGGNTSAIESLVAAFEDYGQSTGQAKGSTEAMIQAVRHLSNTNLDLEATARLNVEVVGAANTHASVSGSARYSSGSYYDPYDPWGDAEGSALGGIVEKPTWFSPFNYAGEAGPEAITPLRHPKQINHIEDKLDLLLKNMSGGIQVNNQMKLVVEIDGKPLDAKIMAVYDKNKQRRAYRSEVIV